MKTVKGILSFKPLKSGNVNVEIEVEGTPEAVLLLSQLYRQEVAVMAAQESLPEGKEEILKDLRGLMVRVGDKLRELSTGEATASEGEEDTLS